MPSVPLWSRVQGGTSTAQFAVGPFASTAFALSSPVAVGDVLVCFTTTGQDNTTAAELASTVTDNLGNTYNRVITGGRIFDSVDTQGYDAWWCRVTVAGTPTITYTPNVSVNFIAVMVDHFYVGDQPLFPYGYAATGNLLTNPGTAVNAITVPVSASSMPDCLMWVCCGASTGTTAVAGSGFTTGNATNATTAMGTEYQVQRMASPLTGTWTDATNGGAAKYACIGLFLTPGHFITQPPNPPAVGRPVLD